MASTINADDGVVSGSAGVKTSADNSGVLELQSNGTTQFTLGSSSVVINEAGADVDFRVEGDTDSNLLFVDASTDRVGVGTNSPTGKLNVSASDTGNAIGSGAATINITNSDETAFNRTANLTFSTGTGVSANTIAAITGLYTSFSSSRAGALVFSTDNGSGSFAERARLDSSGNLGLNFTPSAWQVDVKAIQIGDAGSQISGSNAAYSGANNLWIGNNSFQNSSVQNVYVRSAAAALYELNANNHKWYTAPSGTAGNAITFTQAMTLDADGDLGVGTTSPSLRLHIVRSGDGITAGIAGATYGIRFDNGGAFSSGMSTIHGVDNTFTSTYQPIMLNGSDVRFGTSATERARITAGGALCIGTTSTTNDAPLKTYSTTTNSNAAYFENAASSGPYGIQVRYTGVAPNGTDNEFLACYDQVGSLVLRASIRSNGGLANYSANNVNLASDERLKKDIAPLDSTWSKVKGIEVVNFRYKDCNDGDPSLYGVIAQQVQPIVPELVVVTREAKEAQDAVLDDEGNVVTPAVEASPEYYGIREQPMYWLAIKALQEAMTRIEELEAKVAALESK